MTYTVTLQDFPNAPQDLARTAERRFQAALDRALGEKVLPALKAFQNAIESSADELTQEEIGLAGDWQKAYELAKTAGFRDLGAADEAYFEVRLA